MKVFKLETSSTEYSRKLFEMHKAILINGKGIKLKRLRCNTIVRKSYLSGIFVDQWNRLVVGQ